MSTPKVSRRIIASIALLFLTAMAFCDLKVVSKVDMSINGDYHPTDYTTTYYKGSLVRIDSKNKSIITNSATHKTIELDHLKKTYSITNGDLASDAAQMMKMMQAKISGTVSPTDEHEKIAGLSATKYLADLDFDMKMPQGGEKPVHLKIHMENWTTEDLPVKTQAGSIIGAPNDMIESLMSLAGVAQVKKELSKIKGFSLNNRIITQLDTADVPAPIAIEIDYECVSLSEATINPAMFRIPSDYKNGDFDIDWRPQGKG